VFSLACYELLKTRHPSQKCDRTVPQQFDYFLYQKNATHFFLDFGDSNSFDEFLNQYIYIPELNNEEYNITFIANNIYNCPDTAMKVLDVIPSSEIFIPNSFTPNNDGLNDLWGPVIIGSVKSYNLLVFNRWGEQIFRSTDKNIKWDGWYKDHPVQLDVYVYKLYVIFEQDEEIIERIGRVTVYH
jgi:gliding motility-associated-like protein